MTTLAFNRECMAGDTRVVTGASFYHSDKIYRIGNSLVGTAGNAHACLAFLAWFQSPRRNPVELQKQFGENHDRGDIWIAEINPGGIYLWDGWGYAERLNDPYYAIGSGAMAALEAMRQGMNPEEAVRRAITHDENTGSPIQVEFLLPETPKRKRKAK